MRESRGPTAVLSAADRDSVVGVGPSCARTDAQVATRPAKYGWSAMGYTTCGAPARAAVVMVPAPPWCTTRPPENQTGLLVDVADEQAVVPVVDRDEIAPTAGEKRAAALRPNRVHGNWAMSCGARMLPKLKYTVACGVQERLQPGQQGESTGTIRPRSARPRGPPAPTKGPSTGSAASHWRSAMTWSRTLSTGGGPIDTRWVLSAPPNSALWFRMSRSFSSLWSARDEAG